MSSKKWFPIEANPDVMNKYVQILGFPTDLFCFNDVLSTEDWALSMIPSPVLGIVLLFPVNDNSRAAREERLSREGEVSPSVYHMSQFVSNACGTIGILHLIANCWHSDILGTDIPLDPEGFLQQFFTDTQNMSADDKGHYLENSDSLANLIESAHQSAAQQGQSRVPDINEKIALHFIAFVPKDGCIYELDGRNPKPINLGPYSDAQSFGIEVLNRVVKGEFIDKDPENVNFNIVALTPAS